MKCQYLHMKWDHWILIPCWRRKIVFQHIYMQGFFCPNPTCPASCWIWILHNPVWQCLCSQWQFRCEVLVWLFKVKIRLPRPRQPHLFWFGSLDNHQTNHLHWNELINVNNFKTRKKQWQPGQYKNKPRSSLKIVWIYLEKICLCCIIVKSKCKINIYVALFRILHTLKLTWIIEILSVCLPRLFMSLCFHRISYIISLMKPPTYSEWVIPCARSNTSMTTLVCSKEKHFFKVSAVLSLMLAFISPRICWWFC